MASYVNTRLVDFEGTISFVYPVPMHTNDVRRNNTVLLRVIIAVTPSYSTTLLKRHKPRADSLTSSLFIGLPDTYICTSILKVSIIILKDLGMSKKA